MCDATLAMDAGGTSVKLALISEGGAPVAGTEASFAFDGDTRDALLGTFRAALQHAASRADALGLRVRRVGAACPGPFDFRAGMSLMAHKWPGLRGVPLAPVFAETFPQAGLSFLHDSTAYMLGEAFYGAGRQASNPCGVMLGTGLGYTLMRDRRVLLDDTLSPVVRLWREPFEGGTAEDAVSRRAIRQRYREHRRGCIADGEETPDVREIAQRAKAGERAAIRALAETGELLARVLSVYLPPECDLVIVGGQIARSAGLFLPQTSEGLRVPVVTAEHIADAALYGVACYCSHQPEEVTLVAPKG